jgi:hypothetical protein
MEVTRTCEVEERFSRSIDTLGLGYSSALCCWTFVRFPGEKAVPKEADYLYKYTAYSLKSLSW